MVWRGIVSLRRGLCRLALVWRIRMLVLMKRYRPWMMLVLVVLLLVAWRRQPLGRVGVMLEGAHKSVQRCLV
jgi:hypothetical protein